MAPVVNPEESVAAYLRRLDGVGYFTRSGGWSNIGLDDYITVAVLLVANGFFWTCMIGMRSMLGRHVADLEDPLMIIDFLKSVWIAQVFYTFAIAGIKLAVLAFYWRLFSVNARNIIWIVSGMSIAWFIAIFLCVIFNCLPVRAAWDITITGAKCIPIRSIYLGGAVPNVTLDIIVVAMPMPYVWRLHAPLAQRLILAGMFALGAFIAVVSLVRLIIFLQIPIATSGDVTYNFREIIVWSIVEINIGLVCACLPSLKPALAFIGLNKLFSFNGSRPSEAKSPGPSTGYNSRTGDSRRSRPRKKGTTGGLFSTIGGLTRLDSEEELKIVDDVHGRNHTDVEMVRLSDDSKNSTRKAAPVEGIQVQRDWNVFVDQREGS
ncbi:Nn.00g039190.m01.CDS01 [Neocucurbitaria sp. VM-36]